MFNSEALSLLYIWPVMCPSHFCQVNVESESQALWVRVESESSKILSSHNLAESSHKNCRVASSPWFASSSQCKVTQNFTFFLHFFAMKWRPSFYKMAPDKLESGAQHTVKYCPISWKMVHNVVLTSLIAGTLCLL